MKNTKNSTQKPKPSQKAVADSQIMKQKILRKNALLKRSRRAGRFGLNGNIQNIDAAIGQTKGYLAVLKCNFQRLAQSPLMPPLTVRTTIQQNLVTLSECLDLMWEAEAEVGALKDLLQEKK